MSELNRISLTELFKENERKQVSRVSVVDGSVESIPEVKLEEFDEVLIQKNEGVIKVNKSSLQAGIYDLETIPYEDYIRKSKENQIQQTIQRTNQYDRMGEIVENLFGDDYELREIGGNFWGYNKLGVSSEGEPYIKAMLSNQFAQLNTRKFLTDRELARVVNARGSRAESVAVVNNNRSIKEIIMFEVKREKRMRVNTMSVVNSRGERIPYLEQKLDYIMELGVSPQLWAIYLKTKFEFEEDYTTLRELQGVEFNT